VGIYQDVCVNGDQFLGRPIDEIPQLLPVPFGNARLEAFPLVTVPPQTESAWRPLRESKAQSLFHDGAEGFIFLACPHPGLFQQIISNTDGGLYMAIHLVWCIRVNELPAFPRAPLFICRSHHRNGPVLSFCPIRVSRQLPGWSSLAPEPQGCPESVPAPD